MHIMKILIDYVRLGDQFIIETMNIKGLQRKAKEIIKIKKQESSIAEKDTAKVSVKEALGILSIK